ncbi:MAG: hypothetical protein ABIP03_08485, partial [Aquihabitans sp.]
MASRRPNDVMIEAIEVLIASASVTSQASVSAPGMTVATAVSAVGSRANRARLSLRACNARAVARPMPEDPPVTRT